MAYELGFDLADAIKRQNISKENIVAIRESKIPHVPDNISDKLIALFLDACDSLDETKSVMSIYYRTRQTSPEHFENRDPRTDEIQQCLNNQDYFYLPPTPSGFPVIFHRLSNSTASNYCFDNAIKTFFMSIDACLYKYGPAPGIIFLFDMRDVRLSHLTRVRISSIKKFFYYLQEGLPARLCQIHILNVVSFFGKILAMVKPFMRAEIFKCLYTYTSDIDYDEFYKNWIPKQCLPSDFGGDLPTVAEMHTNFRKELDDLRDYFVAEEDQRNNNAKNASDNLKINEVKSLKMQSLEID
ncbi:alpha-tocopherol transfer protein-like [Bradysia coprophila]|uniref:alpha-tocopherol transfer protein-like n=1 Tax=Bradysia coprophila TaxID=38358 RepID=UPI00187D859A|nr:alpha-tocopherol transfer protein-like [Bradysia coprophila]XP_037039605.1 alpha-tocopherol transfer protein-like [Bradysia coprophila]XP_037039606.1 alpha-tocopherol transfer protein-like [Bradysia coprophila]XP_037039607.1 alpha-tocopherol transfer protein-like [Bradysia coprophila]XP_037039608.1 alpha-tocopherol transfer protein-like [Bradysia coprophila]XP_037039609.1 alpha-tocopherol transfer protein-like [Bradysia coprophila]